MFILTWIGGIFGRFTEKAILYLILAAIIVGGVLGLYLLISHEAKKEQILKDQVIQLQHVIDEQKIVTQQLKTLIDLNNQSTVDFNSTINKIREETSKITDWLNSPEAAKGDRESSDILKQTVDKLSKGSQ